MDVGRAPNYIDLAYAVLAGSDARRSSRLPESIQMGQLYF